MKDIFVSYRRADSSDITGRIFDRLKARFGKDCLFKDVDSIPLGKDFRKEIAEAVGQCKVLLAVIGVDWLDVTDKPGNRRIDDPNDYVRIEISTALDRKIPVIPILVETASMPKPETLPETLRELVFRNATPVRADPDFHHDLDRLCDQLAVYVDPPLSNPRYKSILLTIASILGITLFIVFGVYLRPYFATPTPPSQNDLLNADSQESPPGNDKKQMALPIVIGNVKARSDGSTSI